MTRVVNKYKERGTVYIGCGSRWGNKFSHLEGTQATVVVETREEAVARYEDWIRNSTDKQAQYCRDSLWMLRGETLECFCAPQACHGDVLVKLVEFESTINEHVELKDIIYGFSKK